MTVSAELALHSQRLDYILCVEGIGWPGDESDLSVAFNGDVFCTNDIDSDLASLLGCMIHKSLELPGSISDSIDPDTMAYSPGGMTFSVIDHDGEMFSHIRPHTVGDPNTLDSALVFDTTTVRITQTSYTSIEGDVVWCGGKEAIKLGSKAGVVFTGCIRGYLGTDRGRYDASAAGSGAFAWASGTYVYDPCPMWWDRRVILFAHVPGESRLLLTRIYTGRIKAASIKDLGNRWELATAVSLFPGLSRTHVGSSRWVVKSDHVVVWREANPIGIGGWSAGYVAANEHTDPRQAVRLLSIERKENQGEDRQDAFDKYSLAFEYLYRDCIGGTEGAITAIIADATEPQSQNPRSVTPDGLVRRNRDALETIWSIGGTLTRIRHRRTKLETDDFTQIASGGEYRYTSVDADVFTAGAVAQSFEPFEPGTEVSFCIDNLGEAPLSRFVVNGRVTRNIIDIMLMILTSCNGEFYCAGSGAGVLEEDVGHHSTIVDFRGSSPQTTWSVSQWVGYAMHHIHPMWTSDAERVKSHQVARKITESGSSHVKVEPGFSMNEVFGNGHVGEFQIRNSVYDVLPAGWCMQVHNSRIDIESFESIRDKHFQNADVATFVLGSGGGKLDLWNFIIDNICKPYGILLYIARTTGKLTAKVMGALAQDALLEDYTAVTASHLLSVGDLDVFPSAPVSKYTVKGRASKFAIITPGNGFYVDLYGQPQRIWVTGAVSNPDVDESAVLAIVKLPALESALPSNAMEEQTISALLHTRDSVVSLLAVLSSRLRERAVSPAETTLELEIRHALVVQAGSILIVTDTTVHNPPNPFTGSDGWSAILCRVLNSEIVLVGGPKVVCRVQMLATQLSALFAPACDVVAKGTLATGTDYFFLADPRRYTPGRSRFNYNEFRVGDLVELRDVTGALKESEVIESFGGTESTDPVDANLPINQGHTTINVVGSIVSVIAHGDYLTIAPWVSATVTTNMRRFAAMAGSDALIDADTERDYL